MDKNKKPNKRILSLPIEDIIVNVTEGVVKAQEAMDAHSFASELKIKQAELDRKLGLTAQWYTIPELDLEIRIALEIGEDGQVKTHLVDAEYQSKYGFDLSASSLLQTKIVAVPPQEIMEINLLSEDEALEKISKLKKIVEAYARSDAPYFVTSYYPFTRQGYAGGLWFVILMDSLVDGSFKVRAVAVIDDTSGDIMRLWTDSQITVYGITFTPDEALAALTAVNKASQDELKSVFGFQASTITIILENRPFDSLVTLASLSGIRQSTINKIYDHIKNQQ